MILPKQAHPQGTFCQSLTPGGAKVVASYNPNGTIEEQDYFTGGSTTLYQKLVYAYGETFDWKGNFISNPDSTGNITSQTLWGLASSAATSLTPIRRQEYQYYQTGDSYGLPGD